MTARTTTILGQTKDALAIVKAKRPHSPDCQRQKLGTWDRSGSCERCSAFVRLNEGLSA